MSDAGPAPRWLSERDVVSLIDMGDAVVAVERAFALEGRQEAMAMPKTFVRYEGDRSLQALGAGLPGAGLAGTKTWAQIKPGHPEPLLVVFDSVDGHLRGVIEAGALGQMRTGAAAGVATRWLADPAADTMAVIGSGQQAMTQVAAVVAVRPLRHLRVYSPTPANRERFAQRIGAALGITARAVASVAEAVRDASIVTTAAAVGRPVLASALLAPGTHVNAVGVTVPNKAELDLDVLPRCGLVCADTIDGVRNLSDEFRAFFGAAGRSWDAVTPLSAVVSNQIRRPAGTDLTLYKGMGTGILDVALASAVLSRAEARGIGLLLPRREWAEPRLRAERPAN